MKETMKIHESITPELQTWIRQQKIFFVGSAPLTAHGHVNLSPKGLDCLRIIDNHTVCYMDMTGSGNETSAHVTENGRLTLMFCAFTGGPRILRLYGKGRVVLRHSTEFASLVYSSQLPVLPGARQIIVNDVHTVITSCGYAVPKYDFVKDRSTLLDFAKGRAKEGDPEMEHYQREKNVMSLDGLVTPLGVKYGGSSKGASMRKIALQTLLEIGKSVAMLVIIVLAVIGLAALRIIDLPMTPGALAEVPETVRGLLSNN